MEEQFKIPVEDLKDVCEFLGPELAEDLFKSLESYHGIVVPEKIKQEIYDAIGNPLDVKNSNE